MNAKGRPWMRGLLLLSLHIIQMLTSCLVTAGIAQHAQYGTSNACDYGKEADKLYEFEADSPACRACIAAGAVSLFISSSLFIVQSFYFWKQLDRKRTVHFLLSMCSIVGALLMILCACFAALGLQTTCNQFSSDGAHCGVVFSGGFLENDDRILYYRNLNVIYAAIGSAWVAFTCYCIYGLYELYQFKFYSKSVQLQ